jgi:hypothetical protein
MNTIIKMTTIDYSKVNDIFQCKLLLEDDTEFIIPMREDGYIFATKLCKVVGKKVAKWKNLKETKLLIEKVKSIYALSQIIEVYKGKTSRYKSGTWVHPDLGLHLAQWCSPSFALQVSKWIRELIITGEVKLGDEKSNNEIQEEYKKIIDKLEETIKEKDNTIKEKDNTIKEKDNSIKEKDNVIISQGEEKNYISKKYDNLYTNHQSFLRKKELYKLKEGHCVYLVNMIGSDDDIHSDVLKIKVGFTGKITNRISGYRTSNPYCKLLYVLYTSDNQILESAMKKKYDKELRPNNREFITGVPEEDLIISLTDISELLNIDYTTETQEELDQFNNHIIRKEDIVIDEDEKKYLDSLPPYKRCGGITHLTEESRKVAIENYFKNFGNKDGIARICKECYLVGVYGDKRKKRKVVTIPKFDTTTHKWCNLCENVKEYDMFYRDKCTKDGYNSNCKGCKREQKKAYRKKKKEEEINKSVSK